jgi:hypothetical protein
MGNEAQFGGDGDWSSLRAHLDKPRSLRANTLGNGLAGWFLSRWHTFAAPAPRLELVEKIALGPRHAVALILAEGTHLLVATSAEGAASFFPLHPQQGSGSQASLIMPADGTGAPDKPVLSGREGLPTQWKNRAGRSARRHAYSGRVSW